MSVQKLGPAYHQQRWQQSWLSLICVLEGPFGFHLVPDIYWFGEEWGERLKFNSRHLNEINGEKWLESPSKHHAQPPCHKILEMARILQTKPTRFFFKAKEKTKWWNDRHKVIWLFGAVYSRSQTLCLLSQLLPIILLPSTKSPNQSSSVPIIICFWLCDISLRPPSTSHTCVHLHSALHLAVRSCSWQSTDLGNLAFQSCYFSITVQQ